MKKITLISFVFFLCSLGSSGFGQTPVFIPLDVPGAVPASILDIESANSDVQKAETEHFGRLGVLVAIDDQGNITSVDGFRGPGNVCSATTRPSVLTLRGSVANAVRTVRFAPARSGDNAVTSHGWLYFSVGSHATGTESDKAVAEKPQVKTYPVREPTDDEPKRYTILGSTATTPRPIDGSLPPKPDYVGPVSIAGSGPPPGTRLISDGVLNGKALSLPKPSYPPAARAVRASGAVIVQVLIDEDGTIFSAAAVSGHPLLRAASTLAACGARFSPTLLDANPVKVSGVITYNYVAP